MLGAIIGDVVGSVFEFNNTRSKDFVLFSSYSRPTDDTYMTIAIALAILDCRGDYSKLGEMAIKNMRKIGRKYPFGGYGSNFKKWLKSSQPTPYNSCGNGSAMRVSPIAYVAKSIEEVKLYSRLVTEVTHNHPEGIKGAEATCVAIWMAINNYHKNDIKDYIVKNYYPIDFTIDQIKDDYRFYVMCQETVPQALQAFFESESFEDTLRIAISLGGDSDTIAAIACSIAGAYYYVEQEIIDNTVERIDPYIIDVINRFDRKFIKKLRRNNR